MNPSCLFCDIVRGTVPCHRVFETDSHLAFLTIFPNTPGCTVVIPKAHTRSYVFDQSDSTVFALITAAKTVAQKIDRAFPDVGRTALVFEGFGIDHLHAKLFPLHGTRMDAWKPILSNHEEFHEIYQGFVTTHDGPRAEDRVLADIAHLIWNA